MSRKTPTIVGYTENGHVLLSLQRLAKKAVLSKSTAELVGLPWPLQKNWRMTLSEMAVPLHVFKTFLPVKSLSRARVPEALVQLISSFLAVRGTSLDSMPRATDQLYQVAVKHLNAKPRVCPADAAGSYLARHLAKLTYGRLPPACSLEEVLEVAEALLREHQVFGRILSQVEVAELAIQQPVSAELSFLRHYIACFKLLRAQQFCPSCGASWLKTKAVPYIEEVEHPSSHPHRALDALNQRLVCTSCRPNGSPGLGLALLKSEHQPLPIKGVALPVWHVDEDTLAQGPSALGEPLGVPLESAPPKAEESANKVTPAAANQDAIHTLVRIREACAQETRVSGEQTAIAEGFLYLMTHPLFEGWVKAGMTLDYEKRMATYNVADPLSRFQLEALKWVPNRRSAESELLALLTKVADCHAGEWFKIPLGLAKDHLAQMS